MLLAILSLGLDDELQRLNAVKVILTGLVNLVSGSRLHLRRPCGVGRGRADRGRLADRRRDRSARRPPAVAGGAACGDRRRSGLGDRPARDMRVCLRAVEAADAPELTRIHRTPEVARWWDWPTDDFPWEEPNRRG